LLVLAATALGQGGPPLLTDDTGTPGDGVWEANVASSMERVSGETLWELPLLDVNYGVGERTQLKAEIPWLVLDEEDEANRSGLGNAVIGVKWRFLDEDQVGLSVSTYPQVEFNTSESFERHGLVEDGTAILLPLEIQKDLGIFGVNGEVGLESREGEASTWDWGLAIGKDVTEGLELLAELHGETELDFDEGEVVYNFGLRQALGDHQTLLFSIGRGLRDQDEPELMAYLGVQFVF
jgi:hypothetical protein